MQTIQKHFISLIIFAIFSLLFMASAVQQNYYQVYKTKPENGTVSQGNVVFEDEKCAVYYDLWKNGGDIGFTFYNKTDLDIVLNLDKSFFVLNGVAYDYFKRRIITSSSNSGSSVSYSYYPYWQTKQVAKANSSAYSISRDESPTLRIPPKTRRNLSEYQVTNDFYKSCDLLRYPSVRNIKSLQFNKSSSPYTFYNLISYSVDSNQYRIETKFFVTEITNIPEGEALKNVKTEDCGVKSFNSVRIFKDPSPENFYIQYKKGGDRKQH